MISHHSGPSPWLTCFQPVIRPQRRLLCLPFAGGGAGVFRSWQSYLPAGMEMLCAQLPGRERRIREQPIADVNVIVDALFEAILALEPVPLTVFGHSMGASIGHDLVLRLQAASYPLECFVVSARRAPFLPPLKSPTYLLADEPFRQELIRMGGTAAEVLAHDEMMKLLLPMLRADFELAETFSRPAISRFDCPLLALAGRYDQEALPEDVARWQELAAGDFRMQVIDAGHFYVAERAEEVVKQVVLIPDTVSW